MALLGPLIFYASWPWLWHGTWSRLRSYGAFHLQHPYYNMAYFGVNDFWPPFPRSYPWVMTLFTVPVTTLLVAGIGLWHDARATIARVRRGLRGAHETGDDATYASVLLLGSMLAPLVVYLSAFRANLLPLYRTFSVRMLCEVHQRLDERQSEPFALRALALAWVTKRETKENR